MDLFAPLLILAILLVLSGLAGLVIPGLPGPPLLLGPFLGAMIGELTARRDLEAAGRAGVGAWLGLVVGAVAKFAIAFSMISIFVLVRFLSSAG